MRFTLTDDNRSAQSVIVESKKIKCFLSELKFLLLLFVLFSTKSSFAQITNNYIDYTNGLHGTVCVTQPESNPGPSPYAVFNAPAGTVFTTVSFSSYGTPGGSCSSSFSINSACNASTSQSVVEGYLLGNNSANIPPSNSAFTDPCVGTYKALYVQAIYTQPICSGTSPGIISGTAPAGGTAPYTYSWEQSTTSSSTGFTVIAGANGQNYTPGALTQTTWFRRKVTGGSSNGYSPVLQVTVNITTVSAITTPTCVGGSTGTITVNATGGSAPYTYSLNSGAYQSGNVYTGLAAGSNTITVKSNAGCIATSSATVSPYPNSTDDQTATATNSWVGHIYNGMNFQNYIGHFTETESFNEGFGGDQICFSVSSGATTPSVFTDNFSVRFRMNSIRKGLYVVDLGSDDGSRLTVDGNLIYNNWSDQAFSTRPRVLMNLTGTSSLVYEFYENGGQNQVIFQNLTQVLANTLSTNTTQTICLGGIGAAISGDTYGTLPAGISLSGTGYQWSYSTTPGGTRNNIAGATSATYTPNTTAAPFNVAGTFYIYRNAAVSSSNNTGESPYVATNESNAATITINALSVGGSVGTSATVCSGSNSGTLNLTGQTGSVIRWESSINSGVSWTTIANTTTSQSYTNLTQTTQYRAVVQSGACSSANSSVATITANAVSAGGAVGASATVCSGTNSGTATLTGQTGSVLRWEISTDGGTTWSSVANTTTSQAYSNLTQTTMGRAVVQNGVCASANSTPATITVNPVSVGGSVGTSTTVCSGTNSGTLSVAGQTGNIIRWEYSINSGSTWTTIANTTTSQSYSNLTQTTQYRAVVQSGVCATANSSAATITVSPAPSATISYSGSPFCINSGTASVTSTGTTGGTFSSTAGLSINSATGAINLNSSSAGTYTVTYTIAAAGGCSTYTTTTSITINAIPAAPTVTSPVNYCQNAVASQLTATGSNLTWGGGTISGTAGGTTTLSTLTYISNSGSNKQTNFTTTASNVEITSVSYYVPAWQSVAGVSLALYNSSGTVIATSSTVTTLSNGGTGATITNIFNFTIASPGNYSIGISTGTGTIGGDSPTFPITEATGTINVTGTKNLGSAPYHCFNNIQFTVNNASTAPTPSTTTPGTTNYLVSQTVNGCVSPQATIAVIVNAPPSATISYSGSPFCINSGTATVTRTGTAGGAYSSTAGLSINSATGAINLNSSSAGTYTVTYTIAAAGGCSTYTTTTSITVTPTVGIPVFALGSTSSRCQGAGSVTYTATATNAGGISYSLDAASISGGNSINSSTGAVTYTAGWNGTSTITASASGCGGPATSTHTVTTGTIPSVSGTTTYTCVGGSSGTITASGSGGSTPYTYSLNGSSYQSSNLFTGLAAGTYTLSIKSNTGCTVSAPASITVSPYPNSTDDQTATGTDTWIGHMYSGMNFNNYIGHFTEAETFDEGFGGDYNCFTVSSGATFPSIYTEQFSVRFRMNSSRDGLYVADLGSDDGSRLYIDGTLIYNNWVDQSFSTRPSVLMSLTGSSSLVYEFYENAVNNRVIFNNLKLILANNLTSNTTQSICTGNTGSAIGGDSFGTLPSGISLSGSGYQWTYSSTPTGTRTNISGATSATYSPNTSSAPFNIPGTYYIYRNAILSSTNNTGVSPYVVTNESNAAIITVISSSVGGTVGSNSTVCSGTNSGTVNLTGQNGNILKWQYSIDGGTTWTDIANSTTSQSFSNLTQTTLGRAVVQSGVCTSANSSSVTITVNPVSVGGTVNSSATVCSGTNSGTLNLTGNTGSVIRWEYSTNGGSTWTTIANTTTSQTYSNLTLTTQYRAVVQSGVCTSANSSSVTITVNPVSVGGTVNSSATVCSGTNSGTLNLTGNTGSVIRWEYSTNGGSTWTTIANTTTSQTYSNITLTTQYRAVVQSGVCTSANSSSVTITVNPVSVGGTVNSGATVCSGTNSGTLNLTGNTGSVIRWEYSTNGGSTWTTIANTTTSQTYSNITLTTQYRAVVQSGVCTSANSSSVTITVNPVSVGGTVNSSATVCSGTNSGTLNLTGNTGSVIRWEYSTNGGSTWTTIANTTTSQTYSNITLTTQYRAVVQSGVCTSANSSSVTITVNPVSVGGAVNSSATVCSGTNSGTLNLTGNTGSVIRWEYSSNGGSTWTTIANTTTSQTYSNITLTTQYRAVVQSGVCTSANSNPATITVNPVPSAAISYSGSPFCSGGATGTVTQTGTTGGTYSSTSGLVINSLTGAIDVSSSTPGNYTVTYSIAAGACAAYSTTTNVLITLPGSWIGTVSADWNDSRNWLCGQIPNSIIDATISGGASYYPYITSGVMPVRNININNGGTLTVAGGTLQIFGSITNSGIFDASNGSIEMKGISPQTIPAGAFTNNNVKNLIISNNSSGGVTVAGNVDVYQSLTYGAGGTTLNTSGYITLKSNATETAWVGDLTGHTITGDVTVERYVAAINNWQFLSVPTQTTQTIHQAWQENQDSGVVGTVGYGTNITGPAGGIGFDFTSPNPSMKYWDWAANSYKTITNTSIQFPNIKNGFFIYVRGDRRATASGATPHQPTVLRTKGPLNIGTINFTIPANTYYSIGNPYASRVDFSTVGGITGVGSTFYVWDPLIYGSRGAGGYQTFSLAGGYKPLVPTSYYNTSTPDPYLESGQAIFVNNTSASPATMSFTESNKATGSHLAFRAQDVSTSEFFRTYLATSSGKIADGNAVVFNIKYQNRLDVNDARKISNTGENFGLRLDGVILAIEARAPVTVGDTIYFDLRNVSLQPYQFQFNPENMQDEALTAYLLDNYSKTKTQVSLAAPTTVNFTINSDAASYAPDRFMVVFKQASLASVASVLPVTFVSIKAVQKDEDIVVNWNVANENNLLQYDVEKSTDGSHFEKVATVAANNNGSANYQWIDKNASSGYNYYRVASVDKDKKTSYSTMVNVLMPNLKPNISIYPNPITDGIIHVQLVNQPQGRYSFRLLNPLGQVLVSKQSEFAGGNGSENIQWNYNLAHGVYQLETTRPDGSVEVIRVLY